LVDADRVHALADRARHAFHDHRVEGRRPRQGGREDGGAEGGEAGQALVVRDGGDPKACPRDEVPLQPGEAARTLDRVNGPGSERAREMSDPAGTGLLEGHGIGEGLLQGSHVARAQLRSDPHAGQLGELLVKRHLAQERIHAFGERHRRIRPRPHQLLPKFWLHGVQCSLG
jgi:hypothetical protein